VQSRHLNLEPRDVLSQFAQLGLDKTHQRDQVVRRALVFVNTQDPVKFELSLSRLLGKVDCECPLRHSYRRRKQASHVRSRINPHMLSKPGRNLALLLDKPELGHGIVDVVPVRSVSVNRVLAAIQAGLERDAHRPFFGAPLQEVLFPVGKVIKQGPGNRLEYSRLARAVRTVYCGYAGAERKAALFKVLDVLEFYRGYLHRSSARQSNPCQGSAPPAGGLIDEVIRLPARWGSTFRLCNRFYHIAFRPGNVPPLASSFRISRYGA